MTPADAQRLQDTATASSTWIMWFVTAEVGLVVATARRADPSGGTTLEQFAAGFLDELRTMLPRGLTRRDPTAVMSVRRDRDLGLRRMGEG